MRVTVLVAASLALASVLTLVALRRPAPLSDAPLKAGSATPPSDEAVVVDPSALAAAQRQATGIEESTVPSRPKGSEAAVVGVAAGPLPESARPTKDLLDGVLQVSSVQAQLDPEQAEALNQKMRAIIAQGQAALPVLREFLARNLDLTFGEANGANTLEFNSLRSGLLEALRLIGGPEAITISREVLRTTGDPGEVAQIARNLESVASGEYRPEIVDAARETLAMAAKGPLPSDAAPLFRVLQGFDDASALPVLEEAASRFRYYSALALAGIPEGQGVPALMQMAQSGDRPRSNLNDFALLALSQVADKYPDFEPAQRNLRNLQAKASN